MQKQIQRQQSPQWISSEPIAVVREEEHSISQSQTRTEKLSALALVCDVILLITGETFLTLGIGLVGSYLFHGGSDANVLGASALASLINYTFLAQTGRLPKRIRTRRLLLATLLTSVWLMVIAVVIQAPPAYVAFIFFSNLIIGPIGLAISLKTAPPARETV